MKFDLISELAKIALYTEKGIIMIKMRLLTITILILLTSCQLAPISGPTLTPISLTYTPSPEPSVTSSLTSTEEPTLTATPAPLVLSNFYAKMEGVGKHGNMACINYQGNHQDLEGLTIRGSFRQKNTEKDVNVLHETIDGNNCIEMVDAKYDIGEPISLEIKVKGGNKPIENNMQKIELGDYIQYPFLRWFYGTSGLKHVDVPNPNHKVGYDFQPVSSDYPNGDGHPVFAPCDGEVIRAGKVPNTIDTNFMWINCLDTGYLIQLGHMFNQRDIGGTFEAGDQLGYLHWEKAIGWPHNHTEARRLINFPFLARSDIYSTRVSQTVDYFYPSIQLGGTNVSPYGLWLPDSLPDFVKKMIDTESLNQNTKNHKQYISSISALSYIMQLDK